jgi:hypothetical protein
MVRDVFIRYFARTDESDLGQAAAVFCDLLVATGSPVRLVSTRVAELQLDRRGRSSSVWDRHRALLTTPMDGPYCNVVCSESADWARFHTPRVTNAILFTEQNLLPEVPQPVLDEAIATYGLAYVQTSELANVVERVTGYRPIVVPPGVPDPASSFGRLRMLS